ncbi:Uncharacterized protein TPAR_08516 [Tolypocladium paradoxum]|uniref:Uncharacterized protein n=1 Tax=Tolypocladium paradoxum TaxID=94208 RepID=A0A2S4KM42_9HYPO|nr:Uncharacterized protein TPAR_08516 [Tolypocladium paradoxum]
MADLERDDGHGGLRPNCGICGSSMEIAERFVLLLGNADSTAFSRRIGPNIFPDYGQRPRGKSSIFLCRNRAVASVLSQLRPRLLDDYLDHLWVVAAWRTPWRHAPPFRLEETAVIPDFSIFDGLGISRMRLLPPEVLQIVHGHSSTSLVWRYSAVSELTQRLPAALSDQLLSIPLCMVLAWNRGGQPVTTETVHRLPIIRLTIDSWGIKQVERLSERPGFKRWRTDSLVFVVLDQSHFEGVTAHFKFGLLRLSLPKTCHGLETWDTPTPPDMERCFFYPANITSSTQFRTIDLSQTTGITFFFCRGEIYAVHAHTRVAPCAQSTYQRLSRRRQRSVVWVYVPISKKDPIAALGTRSSGSTCLLFRMKLGGDVPVGLVSSEQAKDLLLSKPPPGTIIYNTLELQRVSVLGAYTTERDDGSPISPFAHPFIGDAPFPNACFSLAPLKGVSRVGVFNNRQTGFCMGILLEYDNGAQRSLGQCRLDVDPVEYYAKPARICFRRQSYVGPRRTSVSLRATIVESTGRCGHSNDEQGWTCFAMRGELEFWFSAEETMLTAIDK